MKFRVHPARFESIAGSVDVECRIYKVPQVNSDLYILFIRLTFIYKFSSILNFYPTFKFYPTFLMAELFQI